mmetsp:Transcript_11467/g.35777  ORF Transcript_11467/g.35777 Transcript_11467/m.35777 type:complete len:201 (-) Transcript_11467:162-764(-)
MRRLYAGGSFTCCNPTSWKVSSNCSRLSLTSSRAVGTAWAHSGDSSSTPRSGQRHSSAQSTPQSSTRSLRRASSRWTTPDSSRSRLMQTQPARPLAATLASGSSSTTCASSRATWDTGSAAAPRSCAAATTHCSRTANSRRTSRPLARYVPKRLPRLSGAMPVACCRMVAPPKPARAGPIGAVCGRPPRPKTSAASGGMV